MRRVQAIRRKEICVGVFQSYTGATNPLPISRVSAFRSGPSLIPAHPLRMVREVMILMDRDNHAGKHPLTPRPRDPHACPQNIIVPGKIVRWASGEKPRRRRRAKKNKIVDVVSQGVAHWRAGAFARMDSAPARACDNRVAHSNRGSQSPANHYEFFRPGGRKCHREPEQYHRSEIMSAIHITKQRAWEACCSALAKEVAPAAACRTRCAQLSGKNGRKSPGSWGDFRSGPSSPPKRKYFRPAG